MARISLNRDLCVARSVVPKAYGRRGRRVPGERRDFSGIVVDEQSAPQLRKLSLRARDRPAVERRARDQAHAQGRAVLGTLRRARRPAGHQAGAVRQRSGATPSSATTRSRPASRNCARRWATTPSSRATSRPGIATATRFVAELAGTSPQRATHPSPRAIPEPAGNRRAAVHGHEPEPRPGPLLRGSGRRADRRADARRRPARRRAQLCHSSSAAASICGKSDACSAWAPSSKAACASAGDQLRITVQLIDVATGYHKWSQTLRALGRRRVRDPGRDRRKGRDDSARRRALSQREQPRAAPASPPPPSPTSTSCAAASRCTACGSRTWTRAGRMFEARHRARRRIRAGVGRARDGARAALRMVGLAR